MAKASRLAKLKAAASRHDLAELLGYTSRGYTAVMHSRPIETRYSTFEIPKKSGGKRTIRAPDIELKKLQEHLSNFLYLCLREIEKDVTAKPLSFGFRQQRWIADNAKRHRRQRWVLNLDLQDFFPSINFGRVRGYFMKDRSFQLAEPVATAVAQIACDGSALPQGAPSSPIISELIGRILDLRMVSLAKKHGATYTRYADDITFSTSQRIFPSGLAVQDADDPSVWHLSDGLRSIIERSGFHANPQKTRMQFRGSRQTVTGLIVNEKVNVPSEYYRRAKAMSHSLLMTGKYHMTTATSAVTGDGKPETTERLEPIEGILGHIYAVTQTEDRRKVQDQRKQPRAIRTLYRRVLFYKYFVALKAPLVVTEGKTDPIYLRAAIERRDGFHPVLGKPRAGGRFDHSLRYFRYGGLSEEILDLAGGGSSNLRSIPLDYKRNFAIKPNDRKIIVHQPFEHPVIILLDNDTGLSAIASTIGDTFDVPISTRTTEPFYHVTKNLYVVKTPEVVGKSCIEHFFGDEVLKDDLDGKTLSLEPQFDKNLHIGKDHFAKFIVKPKKASIDFSGFDPLLERLRLVVQDYATHRTERLRSEGHGQEGRA